MFDPAMGEKGAFREISREIAEKFISSAKEVEKQIAEDDAGIDAEIAKLQSIKAKKGAKDEESK